MPVPFCFPKTVGSLRQKQSSLSSCPAHSRGSDTQSALSRYCVNAQVRSTRLHLSSVVHLGADPGLPVFFCSCQPYQTQYLHLPFC